jgi:hypothetical protein
MSTCLLRQYLASGMPKTSMASQVGILSVQSALFMALGRRWYGTTHRRRRLKSLLCWRPKVKRDGLSHNPTSRWRRVKLHYFHQVFVQAMTFLLFSPHLSSTAQRATHLDTQVRWVSIATRFCWKGKDSTRSTTRRRTRAIYIWSMR